MSTLAIDVDGERVAFKPRESVSGKLRWELDGERAEALNLQLLWHTEGKGTRDAQIVATLAVDHPAKRGEREFHFELPAGPYSFSGKLLSVVWVLQAVVEPSGETEQRSIVVSPSGAEVDLTAPAQ